MTVDAALSVEGDEPAFFNRDAEQGLLTRMLSTPEAERVLMLATRKGAGKTALLRRLRQNCLDSGTAVAYVDLLRESDPLDVAITIRDCLGVPLDSESSGDLPHFKAFDRAVARLVDDSPMGDYLSGPEDLAVDLGGSNVDTSVIAQRVRDVYLGPTTVQNLGQDSDRRERISVERCLRHFLADLSNGARASIVLLLDHLDHVDANPRLRAWVDQWLVRGGGGAVLFRNRRIVVVGARNRLPSDGYRTLREKGLMRAVLDLEPLPKEHLEALFRALGVQHPDPDEVTHLNHRTLTRGYATFQQVLWIRQSLLVDRGGGVEW